MKIQVVNKSTGSVITGCSEYNDIVLSFNKKRLDRKHFSLEIFNENNPEQCHGMIFKFGATKVPSNMLAQWCNIFLQDELRELDNRCCTVEKIVDDGLGNIKGLGKYYFSYRDDILFGLHKRKVFYKDQEDISPIKLYSIDNDIGMGYITPILNSIGYSVDVTFKGDSKNVTKIVLSKVSN